MCLSTRWFVTNVVLTCTDIGLEFPHHIVTIVGIRNSVDTNRRQLPCAKKRPDVAIVVSASRQQDCNKGNDDPSPCYIFFHIAHLRFFKSNAPL